MLPLRVRWWRARRILADEYRRRGMRLERVSLNTTPGTDLLDELARGRIAMRPALVGLDADGALFADGSRVDTDAVVLATGYRAEFPFLPAGVPETRPARSGCTAWCSPRGSWRSPSSA
jgi:hypothetical protein